jgi:hypothetical protein
VVLFGSYARGNWVDDPVGGYRQDKDAILLTYFGEGHGLRSPGNVRDFYSWAFGFLDEHLAEGRP